MDRYGRLNDESLNRLNYAQQQFINKRSNTIITCGWDYRKDSELVIADVFKDYFLKNGIPLIIPNTYQMIKDTNTTINGNIANTACFE